MASASFDTHTFNEYRNQIKYTHDTISNESLPEFSRKVTEYLNRPAPDVRAFVTATPSGPPAKDNVRHLSTKINQEIQRVLAPLNELIRAAEIPVRMYDDIKGWMTVEKKASDVASDIKSSKVALTDWSGPAAEKYINSVSGQSPAAEQLATLAKQVSNSLSDLAGQALILYQKIVVAIQNLIGDFRNAIDALGEIASLEATPEGVTDLDTAINKAIATIEMTIQDFTDFVAGEKNHITNLMTTEADHIALPGGNWPQAVNPRTDKFDPHL